MKTLLPWNSLFVENFHVVSTVIFMFCGHDDVSWIFIGVYEV